MMMDDDFKSPKSQWSPKPIMYIMQSRRGGNAYLRRLFNHQHNAGVGKKEEVGQPSTSEHDEFLASKTTTRSTRRPEFNPGQQTSR